MKKLFYFLLIPFFVIAQTETSPLYLGLHPTVVDPDGAELRGITATATDGLTVVGTYNMNRRQHIFNVATLGPYKLFTDTGSGFAEDTTFAGDLPYGMIILGGDAKDGIGSGGVPGENSITNFEIADTTILPRNLNFWTISSIDAVCNDAGNIDFVEGDNIQILSDNVLKNITFSAPNLMAPIYNAGDFGVSALNSPAQNDIAFANLFLFADTFKTGAEDSAVIYIPDGNYKISETIRYNNSSKRMLTIKGGTFSQLHMTVDDTILAVTGNGEGLDLLDLSFKGTGKTGIGFTYIAVAGGLDVENCNFDSLRIGVYVDDLTGMTIANSRFRHNVYGFWGNFNADGHAFYSVSSSENDTGYVYTGGSCDAVLWSNCVWGRNDVNILFPSGGGFTISAGYSEDSGYLGLIGTDDGNTGNGQRNVLISGFTAQGAATGGFTFYDADRISIIGCKFTGTSVNHFIDLFGFQTRILSTGNFFSGSNIDIRRANDAVIYNGSDNVNIMSKIIKRYDVNTVPDTDDPSEAPFINEFQTLSGDKYLESWQRVGSANRTPTLDYSIRYKSSNFVAGFGTGGGYFDLGDTADPPFPADSSSDGFLDFQNSSNMDELYVGVTHAAVNRWYSLTRDRFLGDPKMEGKDSFLSTGLVDTVSLVKAHPDSFVVYITPITKTPSNETVLSAVIETDILIVSRVGGTISGLEYYWMLRRVKQQ